MPKFPARGPSKGDLKGQSIAVIRTVLHCCISTVLYHRKLLPLKSFKQQDVLLGDSSKSKMMLLTRGPSIRTDTFLEWLDDAALYALDQSELVGLTLNIHPDPEHRFCTLENYTWSVQYADVDNTDVEADGDIVHGGAHGERLRTNIETIAEYCKGLSPLPVRKYLSVTLFLNTGVKLDFPNFAKSKKNSLTFPRCDDYERQTHTFDPLCADSHGLSLKICHMAKTSRSSGGPIDIRDYALSIPLTDNLDWDFIEDRRSHIEQLVTDRSDTQKNGLNMAKALNGMQQSERYTQGDTQFGTISAAGRTQPDDDEPEQYVFNKSEMFHKKRPLEALKRQAQDLHKTIGGTTKSGSMILCSCGHSREEGDMVPCTTCGTWQHLHCYGYIDRNDPRRPDEHICYLCYIDPRDKDNLTALIELALKRRAMYRALRFGISTKADYAERLGISTYITGELFTEFRTKKFIIAASGSHKAGFKLLNKPPWVPISSGDATYGTMLNEIFDPTTFLSPYFEPYTHKPSDFAKDLIVSKGADLPLAVVPAGERRRKPSDVMDELESSTTQKRERYDDIDTKALGRPRKKVKVERRKLLTMDSNKIIDCKTVPVAEGPI